ncbi:helix-turn-helix domain-containing protein [Brevibacterium sediminis]|uniref:helix-turn-helix domain-containing protein n=1 Tax=Brevibacterium sediminis TaxID=1857024 RepID=UPI002175086B|nr:helix-turn-helix domain-containing protein [Brevibacterium sediminis]MCS4593271.1 helix-turn-helix domain-containing protein [Brevibacterium sediminis]
MDVHLRGRGFELTHLSLASESSLWLGSGIDHSVTTKSDSIMLGPRLSPQTEPPEGFLHIRRSTAIRETALLILASSPNCETDRRPLRAALDAELSTYTVDDFPLPVPQHRSARAIMEDPMSLIVPLTAVAERHSMSKRHVERIIKNDLGMSFVQWRTRRRLNLALRRIRAGSTVASAARSVGYRGSDGLIRAISRLTHLTREELSSDLAGAVADSRTR